MIGAPFAARRLIHAPEVCDRSDAGVPGDAVRVGDLQGEGRGGSGAVPGRVAEAADGDYSVALQATVAQQLPGGGGKQLPQAGIKSGIFTQLSRLAQGVHGLAERCLQREVQTAHQLGGMPGETGDGTMHGIRTGATQQPHVAAGIQVMSVCCTHWFRTPLPPGSPAAVAVGHRAIIPH